MTDGLRNNHSGSRRRVWQVFRCFDLVFWVKLKSVVTRRRLLTAVESCQARSLSTRFVRFGKWGNW